MLVEPSIAKLLLIQGKFNQFWMDLIKLFTKLPKKPDSEPENESAIDRRKRIALNKTPAMGDMTVIFGTWQKPQSAQLFR